MSAAKHTPGPAAEAIMRADTAASDAQIATYTDLRDIAVQAEAFTYTVERFMRAGDGSDPRVPPTESEVAEAMYALRAAIAKATGSAS